jgi:Tfp pilus assembly protein PilN
MIQFNLLPDVKLEYLKAQRSRRLVVTVSLLLSAASIVLLGVLLSVDGLQRKHLNDLNHDIATETATLQGKPNIDAILTVQNQLQSLTALHNGKPAAARLFDYLNELTPASVGITNLNIDFTQYTVTLTGSADSLSSVNQYVDTLKLTHYTTNSSNGSAPAFSNVVLSTFGLDTSSKDISQAATFTVTLSYDKNIFDITQSVALSVPTVTTRAQIQNPSDLFKDPAGNSSGGSN